VSTAAPANDLHLLKQLVITSSPPALGALKELCGQLWYLSEYLIVFAFFGGNVSSSGKRAMIQELGRKGSDELPKRITLDQFKIHEMMLNNFVTENTRKFFQILSIPETFLNVDHDTCITNLDCLQADNVVRELRVVKDIAERSIALMQEYDALLTKDEGQTQFGLQIVQEHSTQYPDSKKSTLLKGLSSSPSTNTSAT